MKYISQPGAARRLLFQTLITLLIFCKIYFSELYRYSLKLQVFIKDIYSYCNNFDPFKATVNILYRTASRSYTIFIFWGITSYMYLYKYVPVCYHMIWQFLKDMVIKWIHISVYIYIYKPIKVCNVSPSDIGPVVPGSLISMFF